MSRLSLVLAASFVVGLPMWSFAQDDLNRILERDQIAAQKLQADVALALTHSRKLDAGSATEVLQEALTKVRNSAELSAEDRVRLAQRLQIRMREVAAAGQAKSRADEEAARLAEQRAQREARARDQAAGQRPAPTPNQGPSDIASKVIESRGSQLSSAEKLRRERGAKNVNALADLQKTATPLNGNIEFPANWDRIAERGKIKMTEREVALLKALNSTLSVDFDKTLFRNVIETLQERAGLTILVDESSLKEAMVEYDDPVTFKVSKVTVRTILRKVLADRGLSYVIKEGMVNVVTPQKAREMMVVRTYPINDLVGVDNRQFWGPVFSRAFMLQNAQMIINSIQSSVEPSQWGPNGGGSITFHEPSQSLIIRASAEMHYQLGGAGMSSR